MIGTSEKSPTILIPIMRLCLWDIGVAISQEAKALVGYHEICITGVGSYYKEQYLRDIITPISQQSGIHHNDHYPGCFLLLYPNIEKT